MSGLLEILVAHGGVEDLPKLAHELTFEVDDLLPLVDAAQLLGLADVDDADLKILDDGRVFVAADILESKRIFARRRASGRRWSGPSARHWRRPGTAIWVRVFSWTFCVGASRRTRPVSSFRIAVDWGRYGELFDFDANSGQFTLEPAASDDARPYVGAS